MPAPRQVTEQDFRLPQFKDARVEDFEFNGSGEVVRKDRWECAVHAIRHMVGHDGRSFDIEEVVESVRRLAEPAPTWVPVPWDPSLLTADDIDDFPATGVSVNVRLSDESVLMNASFDASALRWHWAGAALPLNVNVVAWSERP